MPVHCISSRLLSSAIRLDNSRTLRIELAAISAFALSAVELVTAVALSILTSPLAWANGCISLDYWDRYISSCLFTHTWALGTALLFNPASQNLWESEESARLGISSGSKECIVLRTMLGLQAALGVCISLAGDVIGGGIYSLYWGSMLYQTFGGGSERAEPVRNDRREQDVPVDNGQIEREGAGADWCENYFFGIDSTIPADTQKAILEGDPDSFLFVAAHAVHYFGFVEREVPVPNWLAEDSKNFIVQLRNLISASLGREKRLLVHVQSVAYQGEQKEPFIQNWAKVGRYLRRDQEGCGLIQNLIPKDLRSFTADSRDLPELLEWLFQRIKTKALSNTRMNEGSLMRGLAQVVRQHNRPRLVVDLSLA